MSNKYSRHGKALVEIAEKYRAGDIRHCFADIHRLLALGYTPSVVLEDGIHDLADWVSAQTSVDCFDSARHELANRGLTV